MAEVDPVLTVQADGDVRVVTLNRPERLNSVSAELHRRLSEVWSELAADPRARAVVLTGAGRAFSAGGDIPGFIRSADDVEYRRRTLRTARRLLDAMAEFPKPVVAAVNGPAIGLGCNIALCCDIVLMAESAFLADTHVSVGLVCGDGGAAMWPLLTSLLKAKEHLLLGDRIPAAEAVALGMANRVVPDAELMGEAMALAQRLAERPQQAVQDTKRAINLHLQHAIAMVTPFALAAEAETFGTDDVRRAIAEFQQR